MCWDSVCHVAWRGAYIDVVHGLKGLVKLPTGAGERYEIFYLPEVVHVLAEKISHVVDIDSESLNP